MIPALNPDHSDMVMISIMNL